MVPKLQLTTSWDDGHPLDLRVADMLFKHGLRGTFYVPLENSRPVLSEARIRDLSTAFEIGAHTVHHRILTTIPDEEARTEIVQSKARLEEITGKPCNVFCFPSGRYANVHVKMLIEAGFAGVRTVELMSLDRPRNGQAIAIVPTSIQACPNSLSIYLRNAAKRFRGQALLNIWRFHRGKNWDASAVAFLASARESGGVFHLWGHSWEIEEMNQWAQLDRVLAAIGEASRSASVLTNSELCLHG